VKLALRVAETFFMIFWDGSLAYTVDLLLSEQPLSLTQIHVLGNCSCE
jgi:hypothetical protein